MYLRVTRSKYSQFFKARVRQSTSATMQHSRSQPSVHKTGYVNCGTGTGFDYRWSNRRRDTPTDRRLSDDRPQTDRRYDDPVSPVSLPDNCPTAPGLVGPDEPLHSADLLRCFGYQTDTIRRQLRSSQLVIAATCPPLKVRHVRPLRCVRLRVLNREEVRDTRGGSRERQSAGRPPAAPGRTPGVKAEAVEDRRRRQRNQEPSNSDQLMTKKSHKHVTKCVFYFILLM